MKTKLALLMTVTALLAAGCMQDQGTTQMDPLTAAVSGKTLVAGETSVYVNPNGTLSGQTPAGSIAGTWEVRNGQWCRNLTAPAALANSACQDAQLNGNILTLPNSAGTAMVNWTIQ